MANVLIHIGYRKAASTFIKDFFINHPQLHFQHNGIAGFNSTKDIATYTEADKTAYFVFSDNFTYYRGNKPIKTKENIEQYQINSAKTLYEIFPHSKILIITRAPHSSILSAYYESIKNGYHLNSEERLHLPIAKSNLIGHYNYTFLISLYYKTFGKNNVIVIPYELLQDEPDKFLRYLEDELKLEHHAISMSPVNQSLTANENYWYLQFSRFVFSLCSSFGKTGLYFYKRYIIWMGKNRLKKKKLKYLVKFLTFFKGKKSETIMIPEELLSEIKRNNTLLKELPLFEKYLHLYC